MVGARQAAMSSSDFQGFSCTIISVVYTEWSEKVKISSEQQCSGRKGLDDAEGQMRMS